MFIDNQLQDYIIIVTKHLLDTKSYDILIDFIRILKKYSSVKIDKFDIKVDDIELFYTGSQRKLNARNNQLREIIIQSIINKKIPSLWYILNEKWNKLRLSLESYIQSIRTDFTSVSCEMKAGRKYNYDFDMIYIVNNEPIIYHVEFKYGSKCVDNCPQFLSLSAKFNTDYASFYYDNYLKLICNLYSIKPIDKDTYLSYVHQTNYDKHKFFRTLYHKEQDKTKGKKSFVDSSIHEYLSSYNVNIEQLNKKIKETQVSKYYMCCVDGKLYKDFISNDELIVTKVKCLKAGLTKKYNTIVLETKSTSTIHMLLRWRNHAGILNPAWQIKLVR